MTSDTFDIEGWIEDNLENVKDSTGDEKTATCPNCEKFGSFYVNAESGKFVCFKCEFRGRNIVGLLAKVEGISRREATKILFRKIVKLRKMEPLTLEEEIRGLRPGLDEDEEGAELVEEPLPPEFIPVWDGKRYRVPTYLRERGYSKKTLKAWGVGFCRSGRYADRIIIPIRCANGYSFTARDATGAREPKYLNPKGVKHERLLIQLGDIKPGADLVLVEGPTDTLMSWQNGLNTVGLSGKELHDAQVQLLVDAGPGAIIVMLDPEEKTAPLKAARKLSYRFEDVYIAKLPPGVDPGSATRKQAHKAYMSAERFKGERLSELEAALEEARGLYG